MITTPPGGIPEDRPSAVLMNGGNDHQAYFVNFRYTAQGPALVVDANVPATAAAGNGSFHLYGLTNEVVAGTDSQIALTAVRYQAASGMIGLTWRSTPGRFYTIAGSLDLDHWVPLFNAAASAADETAFDFALAPFFPEGRPDTYFLRVEERAP